MEDPNPVRILVVLNPAGGSCDAVAVRQKLEQACAIALKNFTVVDGYDRCLITVMCMYVRTIVLLIIKEEHVDVTS